MKVTIDRTGDDVHMEVERDPLPLERFAALCRLAGSAIGGIVLLGAIHIIGVWAVAWTAGALVAVGLYRSMKDI